jgi:hypothetical protein
MEIIPSSADLGALFMDHLRSVLGEDAFWAGGLRYYTRQHAGGTVTSIDFEPPGRTTEVPS